MSDRVSVAAADVQLIVFACEAGMGSSLMGANQLKKLIKKAKLDIKVIHSPLQELPAATDVVVTHRGLSRQARVAYPDKTIITFDMFLGDPAVKGLVATLAAGSDVVTNF